MRIDILDGLDFVTMATFLYAVHPRVRANPDPITYPVLVPTDGVNQISKEKSYPGYASTYPCIPVKHSVHMPHVKGLSDGRLVAGDEGATPRRKPCTCIWYPLSPIAS